jgi:transcription initiation factor TFIIIB Brf1 subunit/transcription initiation factor TFIIB
MSEFDLFNKALIEYKQQTDNKTDSKTTSIQTLKYCQHNTTTNANGTNVCIECGEEMIRNISHEKEWRYYGPSDSRHSSDPNRVQQRKSEERTIFKDVENMGFGDKIVAAANNIYLQVTKGHIYRGDSRKSIIFASIFHAYKLSGKPQTHERLISIFNLNRKTGLRGLKHVNLNAPKGSNIRTTYITPVNLVEEIMEKFSANKSQIEEVVYLYAKIKNKSSRLNRSRPQSVASGLVYYWIRRKNKDISLKDFTNKVALSELTINKIAKEISKVLKTPCIV